MFGTLAKWLRICGFDTFYANTQQTDDELLKIAKNDGRVLVSRDKKLLWNAKRENLKVIEVTSTEIDTQLRQALRDTSFDKNAVLSRCLLCNSILNEMPKKDVKNKVPEKVFENNTVFWYCPNCKKIYWRGTHYEDMLKKIDEL
jgi:uncharacterized protein with PIN domain